MDCPEKEAGSQPGKAGSINHVEARETQLLSNLYNAISRHFRKPLVASKSYRYLARQVAQDLASIEGGKLIVFSSATDITTNSEILLMFGHFLHKELNARVLVIDATLTNSGISQLLGLGEQAGIVDVLTQDNFGDFDSVTHELKENISFIAAGVVPQREMPYASEGQIEAMIARFKNDYDYVIAQQDDIRLDTRYLHFAKSADLVLLHLEELQTPIKNFEEIKEVFLDHQITNVRYILSES